MLRGGCFIRTDFSHLLKTNDSPNRLIRFEKLWIVAIRRLLCR